MVSKQVEYLHILMGTWWVISCQNGCFNKWNNTSPPPPQKKHLSASLKCRYVCQMPVCMPNAGTYAKCRYVCQMPIRMPLSTGFNNVNKLSYKSGENVFAFKLGTHLLSVLSTCTLFTHLYIALLIATKYPTWLANGQKNWNRV